MALIRRRSKAKLALEETHSSVRVLSLLVAKKRNVSHQLETSVVVSNLPPANKSPADNLHSDKNDDNPSSAC